MNQSGNNEAVNQMYITAIQKYEAVKDDYDSLHNRYADLIASHSSAMSKLELTQEEVTRLKKSYDEVCQERNAAIRERNGLKQQCTAAIRQWDNALRERNEIKEALAKVISGFVLQFIPIYMLWLHRIRVSELVNFMYSVMLCTVMVIRMSCAYANMTNSLS